MHLSVCTCAANWMVSSGADELDYVDNVFQLEKGGFRYIHNIRI